MHTFSSITGYYVQCSPTQSYSWAVVSLFILLIIPVLDQVIFPILGEFTPSMLRRMGVGFCAVMLCCSIQLGIEHAAAAMRNLPENMTSITCEKNLQGVFTGYHFLLIAYVPFFLTCLAEISSIVPGKIMQTPLLKGCRSTVEKLKVYWEWPLWHGTGHSRAGIWKVLCTCFLWDMTCINFILSIFSCTYRIMFRVCTVSLQYSRYDDWPLLCHCWCVQLDRGQWLNSC